MRTEGLVRGIAGLTQVFIVFIIIFGGIGLLTHNISYILLPIFGFAIGLLKTGIKVNKGTRIVLLIFSIGAIGYLFLWFLGNILSILTMANGSSLEIELAYGLPPGTYLFLWFVTQLLPVLVLVIAGFLAAILSPTKSDLGKTLRSL